MAFEKVLILTHQNPDFDAVSSTAILKEALLSHNYAQEVSIQFISAYTKGVDTTQYDKVFAVDITPKFNVDMVFDHHNKEDLENEVTATEKVAKWICETFGENYDDYDKLVSITTAIDYLDLDEWFSQGVALAFEAVKRVSGQNVDIYNNTQWIPIGIVEKTRDENKAKSTLDEMMKKGNAGIVKNNYKVLWVKGNVPPGVSLYAFRELRVDFYVYVDGNNIGVSRNALLNKPDLNLLKKKIEEKVPDEVNEWFFHPGGFIAARGTRKNPVDTPSKLDVLDLAELVSLLEGNHQDLWGWNID